MARIRRIEIANFRGIARVDWRPSPGLNCLIGPGDQGKSTVLDAIDLCLGARRSILFTDADFYKLDVGKPIEIRITLGDLPDELKNLDVYGLFVRGYDSETGTIEDEPSVDTETVLVVQLAVEADLEPSWTLVSERAQAQDQNRDLRWSDRVRLAPTRIGRSPDYHFAWRKGSVLNKLSDEEMDASAALAAAARQARETFGNEAKEQLSQALAVVADVANDLGVQVGGELKALLDAHSVSFGGGTVALHGGEGVPLRALGAGSTRLLVAGLQGHATTGDVILVDEVEFGLEPHRVIRFLDSIGAKDPDEPLQAIMTSHSPVAVRELSANQLFVVRAGATRHEILPVPVTDDVQSTIRLYADAFLATSVVACEGASEVGLLRGLDQLRVAKGARAFAALGVAPVDCGGGGDKPFLRGSVFRDLGYRTATFRDNDITPSDGAREDFVGQGGNDFTWSEGLALEDELFRGLSADAAFALLEFAIGLHGEEIVDQHIRSVSEGSQDLANVRRQNAIGGLTTESRQMLGRAARTKRAGWFKQIRWMEDAAREIIGPDLANAAASLREPLVDLFRWMDGDGP